MTWKHKSYDAVPALSVRGPHLRHAMKMVMLSWMFGATWLACISGSQMKIFSNMLGFGDFTFGLMAALPFIATLGQLGASLLIERTGLVKYQFMQFMLIHRSLWLAVGLTGLLLPAPSGIAIVAVLSIMGVSWFTGALGAPPWLTWMGSLLPRRVRGRFFANRERLALGTVSVTVLMVGLLMDIVHDPKGPAYQPAAMWAIFGILAVATICGMADILCYRHVPEILPVPSLDAQRRREDPDLQLYEGQPTVRPAGLDRWKLLLHDLLIEPLSNRVFRSYVLFGATVTFSVTCSSWYFWLNAMDNLGFSSLAANSLFMVIGPVAGIFAARAWGRAIDRWGRRPVLVLGTLCISLSVVPWLFVSRQTPAPDFAVRGASWALSHVGQAFGRESWVNPETALPIGAYLWSVLACIIGGAAWPGVNVAQTNIVLGFSEGTGKSRYIAASAVLISAGGALGGLVGGVMTRCLEGLQQHPIAFGPVAWTNWHLSFVLAIAARLLSMVWLYGMPDAGATPVRAVARQISVNAYNNIVTTVFYPLRVFGWRRSGRPTGRQNGQDRQK
jgi:MFS family permease